MNKDAPNKIKKDLAIAYQVLAHLGMDDHTYTHLSARDDTGDFYYIYPFGYRFEEVTPNLLLKISFDGRVVEGDEAITNPTGYITHGSLYKKRQDIKAIFHIHTPEIVAVSVNNKGLLPISQWALHFYGGIAYHDYDSLLLDESQGQKMSDDIGDKYVLLMRHHGALIAGRTVAEAMFYTYHLQQACKTQCLAMPMVLNGSVTTINEAMCEEAFKTLIGFEKDLGQRDWQAWERLVNNKVTLNNQ